MYRMAYYMSPFYKSLIKTLFQAYHSLSPICLYAHTYIHFIRLYCEENKYRWIPNKLLRWVVWKEVGEIAVVIGEEDKQKGKGEYKKSLV